MPGELREIMMQNIRFDLQEVEYRFPYHYLPKLTEHGVLRLHRHLAWGLDYITYMTFISELIRQRQPESLLDVGCGDGRLLHMIKSDVPHVSGIDLSERAIGFARAFNPDCEFICGDIVTVSKKYAFLTLIEVLEHIPDDAIPTFLQNLAGLLHVEGRVLISVPTVNVPLNKKHYRHYDLELLKATIEPYFEIEKHWWLYRRGALERCIRSFLCNRLYVLNSAPLLAVIWRIHQRIVYRAQSSSGAHLICLAKLRQEIGSEAGTCQKRLG